MPWFEAVKGSALVLIEVLPEPAIHTLLEEFPEPLTVFHVSCPSVTACWLRVTRYIQLRSSQRRHNTVYTLPSGFNRHG